MRVNLAFGREGLPVELPAEFDYLDRWGSRFLWLKGCAYTSHHRIGEGLHVLGAGHCVFLPPSYTPHRNFAKRG